MDINTSIAARAYSQARPATQPNEAENGAGKAFADAADGFALTLQKGEETARAAMVGSADPQALVQALAETQLAVETAVTVRDKVVEAYQEILRMPV
ncbi:flagellar hook-basal body protein FliE [Defluviimonas sp. 20V17]|uniref:Flagellar hook-basal body complex protein FliE n=1 Tax=Allgaiera indica TaxID=765699 RepID=A0AAN4URH7_9RHOB|nr:flagellar hook-basal body complex protein FliE [Allgaiera indica]KDB02689.1 flagellar hook-basal body protein FliE [Defluviimonas sp. 20V17]GHE01782.1 flagellar hook-basal body protein FliE [Allgaiera indica]SDW93104.1 flagellar hook-basal body complex protein FliE [Allgaiera indica]